MPAPPIKVVIFDLGEVLLRGLLGAEERIAPRIGWPPERVNKALHGAHLERLFRGEISEDRYIAAVLEETGWMISPQTFKALLRENFDEIPGTRAIIKTLKEKFKIVVLSVHAREWIDYCRGIYGLDQVFSDGAFFSFEMAAMKPEREAFHAVLETLRKAPEEVLFIDDSEANVQAARQLGIHVIQFESAEKLKKDLMDLGILEG